MTPPKEVPASPRRNPVLRRAGDPSPTRRAQAGACAAEQRRPVWRRSSGGKYGRDLEANLRDLHVRMKAKRYRHQPIRRVQIPKERGGTRPIGISAFEDKLVQDALRAVLEAGCEGLSGLLVSNPQGTLGDVLQDTQCEPETDHPGRLRLVSSPPTPTGRGSAQSAHEAHPGPFQLLRGERQLSKSAARPRAGRAVLVQVALLSEPAHASHLGAVRGPASRPPAPDASDPDPDLGAVATSLPHGGAGWWKSPCPDLERARGGQLPRATRQRRLRMVR